MVSHRFTWAHGQPQTVKVTGTFDNWSASTSLERNESGQFTKVVDLPANIKTLYKFIIDGQWMVDWSADKEYDSSGMENNYVCTGDEVAPSHNQIHDRQSSVLSAAVLPSPTSHNSGLRSTNYGALGAVLGNDDSTSQVSHGQYAAGSLPGMPQPLEHDFTDEQGTGPDTPGPNMLSSIAAAVPLSAPTALASHPNSAVKDGLSADTVHEKSVQSQKLDYSNNGPSPSDPKAILDIRESRNVSSQSTGRRADGLVSEIKTNVGSVVEMQTNVPAAVGVGGTTSASPETTRQSGRSSKAAYDDSTQSPSETKAIRDHGINPVATVAPTGIIRNLEQVALGIEERTAAIIQNTEERVEELAEQLQKTTAHVSELAIGAGAGLLAGAAAIFGLSNKAAHTEDAPITGALHADVPSESVQSDNVASGSTFSAATQSSQNLKTEIQTNVGVVKELQTNVSGFVGIGSTNAYQTDFVPQPMLSERSLAKKQLAESPREESNMTQSSVVAENTPTLRADTIGLATEGSTSTYSTTVLPPSPTLKRQEFSEPELQTSPLSSGVGSLNNSDDRPAGISKGLIGGIAGAAAGVAGLAGLGAMAARFSGTEKAVATSNATPAQTLEQTAIAAATQAASNAYTASGLGKAVGQGTGVINATNAGFTAIGTAVNKDTGLVGTSKIVEGVSQSKPSIETNTGRIDAAAASGLMTGVRDGARVERISEHAVLAEVGLGGAAIGTAVVTDSMVKSAHGLGVPEKAVEHLSKENIRQVIDSPSTLLSLGNVRDSPFGPAASNIGQLSSDSTTRSGNREGQFHGTQPSSGNTEFAPTGVTDGTLSNRAFAATGLSKMQDNMPSIPNNGSYLNPIAQTLPAEFQRNGSNLSTPPVTGVTITPIPTAAQYAPFNPQIAPPDNYAGAKASHTFPTTLRSAEGTAPTIDNRAGTANTQSSINTFRTAQSGSTSTGNYAPPGAIGIAPISPPTALVPTMPSTPARASMTPLTTPNMNRTSMFDSPASQQSGFKSTLRSDDERYGRQEPSESPTTGTSGTKGSDGKKKKPGFLRRVKSMFKTRDM